MVFSRCRSRSAPAAFLPVGAGVLPLLGFGLFVVVGVGCGGPAAGSSDSSPAATGSASSLLPPTVGTPVLGVLDGEELTLDEISDEDRFQLAKLRTEYIAGAHGLLEQIALRMARGKVLTREAEAKGMTLDDYLGREVGPPEISDAEVEQVYQRNLSSMGGRPLEQVRESLRQQIAGQKFNWQVDQVADSLLAAADWDLTVPAYRLEVETEGHASLGPANASVEVVVFSDFECPYCKRFNTGLDQLREEFPDDVKLVFRHHPLRNIHPDAQKAAEASICAGDQNKFWEFHDALWTDEDLSVPRLERHAADLGLDSAAFDECLSSGRYFDQVQNDVTAVLSLGQGGTPAVFVNGRHVGGAISASQLRMQIERELAESD